MTRNRKEHWQGIFTTKGEQDVSWFEALPAMSLQMLESAGLAPDTCVLDVGGGDSRLVDVLAARGLECLAVLDVSGAALSRAQQRLGDLAGAFTWIESDVTAGWSLKPMDIWHDRAVFHFLTTAEERAQYLTHLRQIVKPGGAVIIATFALDGPERCSGLPVARYSAEMLAAELGREFRLLEAARHEHQTPWGAVQPFVYARFCREYGAAPILEGKDAAAPAVLTPLTVLREAKRQRQLPGLHVPAVCVLDPDPDGRTTDAPFRETEAAIAAADAQGVLCVEMECAGLYAFAHAQKQPVLCLAHVTNTMGRSEKEFEKGDADGVHASLSMLEPLVRDRVGRPRMHNDVRPDPPGTIE